jgi:hypothetical protein
MGLLGALFGNGSPAKEIVIPPKKDRSVYYYANYNSFQKGDRFESVVRGYFPENLYDVVNSSISNNDPNGKNDEQSLDPDFKVRHKLTGNCFWVGCKFVDRSSEGKIQLSANEQLIKYQQFQENHKQERVYIVMGFGGMPHRPKSLYCIPLKEITCPELSLNSIEKYRHRVDQVFRYENGTVQ